MTGLEPGSTGADLAPGSYGVGLEPGIEGVAWCREHWGRPVASVHGSWPEA